MDEVVKSFENTLGRDDDEGPKTSFDGMYKYWGKLGNQEERRKEILEIQKGHRHDKLDKFRGILELMNAVEEKDIFKTHPKAHYRPNIYVAGFNKASPTYNNVLMMSEWLIEKPTDFNENWYVVPCPKGVRMLVVANQGTTKCYTKYGHFRFQITSALPGGHRPKKANQCCVLDCFYYEKRNTMFILDLLAWNNQPFTDGETDFRQYWLESQLAEIPGLQNITKRNEMLFKLLPKTPCDPKSFQSFMMTFPPFEQNDPALDGLLFYHKRGHYVSGQTPLVGWLFPYMVPEILGADIQIHDIYALEKPLTYVDQKDFIEKFEAKNAKKAPKSRKLSSASSMDTEEIQNAEGGGQEAKPDKKSGNKSKHETNTDSMEAEETQDKTTKPDKKSENKSKHETNTDSMEAEETQDKTTKPDKKSENKSKHETNTDSMEAEETQDTTTKSDIKEEEMLSTEISETPKE